MSAFSQACLALRLEYGTLEPVYHDKRTLAVPYYAGLIEVPGCSRLTGSEYRLQAYEIGSVYATQFLRFIGVLFAVFLECDGPACGRSSAV